MISVATMDDAAVATHELYQSYLRAGFDKKQALTLTMHQLSLASAVNQRQERGNDAAT